MRTQLRNGALAGLVGGAVMGALLLVVGEGPLQRAIDLEPAAGEEVVSRSGQQVGGVLAALLVGTALGLVFAVALRVARGRSPLGLAACGFVALHLVPFLKYPPNPPGIGESETVGRRTALYVVMVAWGVVSVWSGARARRWLAQRQVPPQLAWPAAAATTVGLVVVVMAVLPPGPSPDAVPASVVWDFRLASLAGWAAYWSVLGTVFGWLTLPAGLRRLPSPEGVAAD
jgi:hypothetical protein